MHSTGLTKDQKKALAELKELLRAAETDPQFAEAMREHGYDEAGWTHGKDLAKALKAAGRSREEAKSVQYSLTNAYDHQLDMTWAHGKALAQNCIRLFQGQIDWLQSLGLHRRRKNGSSEESWIIHLRKDSPFDQLVAFLTILHEVIQNHAEMAEILAKNGFPAEIVARGAAEVEALAATDLAKKEAMAAVPRLKLERDHVYEMLFKWLECAQEAAVLARKEIERSKMTAPVMG
jgi:hypothetical protein